MKDRFYKSCMRDNFGGNIVFHADSGYTTNLANARVYTREEAQRSWDGGREFDIPISADHADALAVTRVDMQEIPNHSILKTENKCGFVAFKKNEYCGNDVYWASRCGHTLEFREALTMDDAIGFNGLQGDVVVLPYTIPAYKARRVLRICDLNKRVMVQGAGIKMPEHVKRYKRYKRRSNSGLTRHNCPVCGKISWQGNPYDFDGCNDVLCDGYRSQYF